MPTIESRLFIDGPLHGRTLVINTGCYLRVPVLNPDADGELYDSVPVEYVEYHAMRFKNRTLMVLEGMTKDEVLEKVVEMLP